MMKMLLIGEYRNNAGPSNVNRALIHNSDKELMYIKSKSTIFMIFEIIIKAALSDVLLVSGCSSRKYYSLLSVFKKPMVYILHGYYKYENVINNLNLSEDVLKAEQDFLEKSDLILAVSKNYSEWFTLQCPHWKDKIKYLNNGVNISFRPLQPKIDFSIAVSGGNRKIKNNIEICRAIELLNKKGNKYQLYVFGRIYENNDEIANYPFVQIMGQLDKEDYYRKLDQISCFILNSELEPFGLVVADAINCNCSLLVSKNVGARSIIDLKDVDIINDPHSVEEIASKIELVFKSSNSERLAKSIDLYEVSEEAAYANLKKMCIELLRRKYKNG